MAIKADGFTREDKLNVYGPADTGCIWKIRTSALTFMK